MAIFEVTDPRGYKVICTEERWKSHILVRHPEMVNYIDEAKQAVERPTFGFIYADATDESRNIYYSKAIGDRYYIKVVVKFDNEEGKVVTAFPTDGGKDGENLIWPTS